MCCVCVVFVSSSVSGAVILIFQHSAVPAAQQIACRQKALDFFLLKLNNPNADCVAWLLSAICCCVGCLVGLAG